MKQTSPNTLLFGTLRRDAARASQLYRWTAKKEES